MTMHRIGHAAVFSQVNMKWIDGKTHFTPEQAADLFSKRDTKKPTPMAFGTRTMTKPWTTFRLEKPTGPGGKLFAENRILRAPEGFGVSIFGIPWSSHPLEWS